MILLPALAAMVFASAQPSPECPETPARPPRHELTLQVGRATSHPYDNFEYSGAGGRLTLLERIGPYLALGPELALYANAGTTVDAYNDTLLAYYPRGLLQLGVLGRSGMQLGPVRLSLLMGLSWLKGFASSLGVTVGGEVEVTPVRWLHLVLDARTQRPIHEFGSHRGTRSRVLGVGTRLIW